MPSPVLHVPTKARLQPLLQLVLCPSKLILPDENAAITEQQAESDRIS